MVIHSFEINIIKQVLILTEEFRPSKKGGIATWSNILANYLHNEDYNVTVYVKKKGGINNSFNHKTLPFKVKLIGGRDWAFFKKWYVKYSIISFLKKSEKPIIISTNWELSQGIIFHKKKYNFALITILHGLEVTRLNTKKYKNRIKSFSKTLLLTDKIISVSNYTKSQALNILKVNVNIIVIPNFVDKKIFFPLPKNNILKEFNFKKTDFILLTISRLIKRKGHFIVIESLKSLLKKYSNIKYIIAGTGNKSYEEKLRNHVQSLKLDNSVFFLGYVNDKIINKVYNLCHLFVMTSLPTDSDGNSEGFGITFLEANACAKPVIGTNVGGISDAITDGKNGFLIKPNSPLKLEEAIIKIMDNKKLYKRLSSNSLNIISKKYEINVIGKKYKILINQLYDSL